MPLVRPNILSTAGYIPGEQPIDPTTIKLNTNENPYPPSPRVMEAVAAVIAEQLRRYPSPKGQPFREAAAQVHGIPPDWILPFNGGDELLSVAIRRRRRTGCRGISGAVVLALSDSHRLERFTGNQVPIRLVQQSTMVLARRY